MDPGCTSEVVKANKITSILYKLYIYITFILYLYNSFNCIRK